MVRKEKNRKDSERASVSKMQLHHTGILKVTFDASHQHFYPNVDACQTAQHSQLLTHKRHAKKQRDRDKVTQELGFSPWVR